MKSKKLKEILEILKLKKKERYSASIVRLIPGVNTMFAIECTKNSIGTIEEEDFIDFEDDSTYEIISNIEEGKEIFEKTKAEEFAIINRKIKYDMEEEMKIKTLGKNRYLKS